VVRLVPADFLAQLRYHGAGIDGQRFDAEQVGEVREVLAVDRRGQGGVVRAGGSPWRR
jgi:hypothetical protein